MAIFPQSPFFSRLGDILKRWINIFTAEKPRPSFYGMKIYAEYTSFLNHGSYFHAKDVNRENCENMMTAEK